MLGLNGSLDDCHLDMEAKYLQNSSALPLMEVTVLPEGVFILALQGAPVGSQVIALRTDMTFYGSVEWFMVELKTCHALSLQF